MNGNRPTEKRSICSLVATILTWPNQRPIQLWEILAIILMMWTSGFLLGHYVWRP